MAGGNESRGRTSSLVPPANPKSIESAKNKQPYRSGRKRRKQNQRRLLLLLAGLAAAIGVFILIFRFVTREKPKVDVVIAEEDMEVSTLTLYRNGKLTVRSVESFGRSYYDREELKDGIDAAVKAYNEPEKRISKDDFSVKDNIAVLKMTYTDSSDYEAFNEMPLFYGTLADAVARGYDLTPILYSTNRDDTNKILSRNDFEELGTHKILYLAETLTITSPYRVLYNSPNLDVVDKKTIAPNQRITESNPAIIIFK